MSLNEREHRACSVESGLAKPQYGWNNEFWKMCLLINFDCIHYYFRRFVTSTVSCFKQFFLLLYKEKRLSVEVFALHTSGRKLGKIMEKKLKNISSSSAYNTRRDWPNCLITKTLLLLSKMFKMQVPKMGKNLGTEVSHKCAYCFKVFILHNAVITLLLSCCDFVNTISRICKKVVYMYNVLGHIQCSCEELQNHQSRKDRCCWKHIRLIVHLKIF